LVCPGLGPASAGFHRSRSGGVDTHRQFSSPSWPRVPGDIAPRSSGEAQPIGGPAVPHGSGLDSRSPTGQSALRRSAAGPGTQLLRSAIPPSSDSPSVRRSARGFLLHRVRLAGHPLRRLQRHHHGANPAGTGLAHGLHGCSRLGPFGFDPGVCFPDTRPGRGPGRGRRSAPRGFFGASAVHRHHSGGAGWVRP
jgi:hypothetical protein